MRALLRRIDVLPWGSTAAQRCGLPPLDRLIAAPALCLAAVLVTNDRAFGMVDALPIEDWSTDQAA